MVPDTVYATAELNGGTVTLAPLTVTGWLAGEKANPVLVGVTV
jgi:hypothetical protein